jgi:hypothetical protein
MVVERQHIAVARRVDQGRLAQRAGARIEGDRLEQVPEATESNCLQNAAQAPISYSTDVTQLVLTAPGLGVHESVP